MYRSKTKRDIPAGLGMSLCFVRKRRKGRSRCAPLHEQRKTARLPSAARTARYRRAGGTPAFFPAAKVRRACERSRRRAIRCRWRSARKHCCRGLRNRRLLRCRLHKSRRPSPPAANRPSATAPNARIPIATQPIASRPMASKPNASRPTEMRLYGNKSIEIRPAETTPRAISPTAKKPFATRPGPMFTW